MNTPVSSHKRFHDLDALRAFAMLLGILLHGMMSFMAMPVNINPIQDTHQQTFLYETVLSAIHGFRMPLFFLVSGFFTTMLWKKRGLRALISHRATRIGLPLLIGLFTLIPAVFAVNILWSNNVWYAAARGNVHYVEQYIEAGGDLQAPMSGEGIPGDGGTPLHIAAGSGQAEVAQLLIDRGAEVSAVAFDKVGGVASLATPLHWAAGSGHSEMVQLLLNSGANVNPRDGQGKTPLDYATEKSHQSLVAELRDAGGQASSELPDQRASSTSATAVDPRPKDHLRSWIGQWPPMMQLAALLFYFPLFAHLWFLWYLLWLVACFVIVAGIVDFIGLRPLPSVLLKPPVAALWLLPLTLMPQLFMLQSFGVDTATGPVPWPPTLLYYGVFFAFGAVCFGRPEFEQHAGRKWTLCFVLAAAIFPIGMYAIHARDEQFFLSHFVASLSAVCYAWLMTFGLIGVFRQYFSAESHWARYISDSSYWLYLIHLPLVQALQFWVSEWPLPSFVKLLLICGITVGTLLLTYEYGVRYTWIGAMLNGRKRREEGSREAGGVRLEVQGER